MRAIARFLSVACLLLVAACSAAKPDEGPLVLAAASLQDGLTEVSEAWAAQGHPKPVLSFAGTSAIARQVLAGADADLFISADEEWMDRLESAKAIQPGSRSDMVSNSLVLVAPAHSQINIDVEPDFPLADALGNGRLALADPEAVPAGRYAKEALTYLGVWNSVSDRVAPAENVRAALALVAQGEAPLGVVYATDALAEPGVEVIGLFPPATHRPIAYPVAVLATSRNPEARAFHDFLLSDDAQAIFRRSGFESPE